MDFRLNCPNLKDGEVPLVIGCDSNTARFFSNSDINESLVCGTNSDRSRQSTPGTPNPLIAEDSVYYALHINPQSIRNGYRFGAGGKVSFELANFPGSKRVSGLHFRVLLTGFNTWVLIDESAAGTSVNDDKLVSHRAQQKAMKSGAIIRGNSQVALRPNERNSIEIGSLNFNIYIHGDPAEFQLAPDYLTMPSLEFLELQSRPSLSTAVARSEADLLVLKGQAQYYEVPDQAKPWDCKTKVLKMIHKETGAVVIGKLYTQAHEKTGRALYHHLRDILSAGHLSNIIPFLSETSTGSSYAIISEYWPQATSLEELLENEHSSLLPSEAAFGFMFAQILEALRFLAQNKVIHRDIKPAAILIAPVKYHSTFSGMTSRLSGFSESTIGIEATEIVGHERYQAPEMDGKAYDAKVDVYALSKLVEECLSLKEKCRPGELLSDLVALGLTKDAARRPLASQLCESFDRFTGGHYREPFQLFYVKRHFTFACTDSFDKVDKYVRVTDVLDVLVIYTECDPSIASARLKPFKIAKNGNRFDGPYCRLKKAEKLFSKCNIYWAYALISKERNKFWLRKGASAWFDLSASTNHKIHYHAPSMMMNISDLLQFTGRTGYSLLHEAFAPRHVQEVRGEGAWEGMYIDQESFQKICQLLRQDCRLNFSVVTKDPKSIKSHTLRDRFIEIDPSQYIVLVTNRIMPDIILLNRDDCTVNMRYVRNITGDKFVSAEKAIVECDNIGLGDVSLIIKGLMNGTRNLNWKCH